MADTVELVFPLEVRGEMQVRGDDIEWSPRITVFTDDRIKTTMERRLLTATWQSVDLRLRARRLPRDSAYAAHIAHGILGLDGVSVLRTKMRLTAEKNAGSARMSLATLFAEPRREYKCPLEMTLADEAERHRLAPKGTVWVRARSPIQLDGRPLGLGLTVDQAEEIWRRDGAIREQRAAAFRALIGRWQELFDSHRQTFPAAQNINCYIMRAADGAILPSIGYMLQPKPVALDVSYYEHALSVVLRRERMTAGQLVALPAKDRRVGSIAIQMLMLWCNYVPYVSDQAWAPLKDTDGDSGSLWARLTGRQSSHHLEMKHLSLEEFEVAELYNDDDCEGVGAVIVRHHGYVLSIPAAKKSAALNCVSDLLRLYAPLLLLCGVTSADLGGDYAALTAPGAKMGAHMFALFVPLARLMRMINRVSPRSVHDVAPTPDVQFELDCTETLDMPILCAEGTGLLAPVPLSLPEHKRLILPPPLVATGTEAVDAVTGARDFSDVHALVGRSEGQLHFGGHLGSFNRVFTNNSLCATDLMQAVYPEVLSGGVRKWYHIADRPDVTSHFYRTVQLALTPAFERQGSRVYSLVFMQRDPLKLDWTVGCTFGDLLSEGTAGATHEVGLMPEPAPDKAMLDTIISEMRREPRPPVLHPPPETLGTNNTWDPTALVPTMQQHTDMQAALHVVRRAALIAEVTTMQHAIRHANSANFVGTPHLLSSCDCERRLAQRLLDGRDTEVVALFDGDSVQSLVEKFVRRMSVTSMPPDQPDRRTAVVAEYAHNYEQWQQRSTGMIGVVSQPIRLANATLFKAGLCADFEHVTATTGGLMPQIHLLVQY